MSKPSLAARLIQFIALVALVAALSHVSTGLWADKPETLPEPQPMLLEHDMTVAGFGQANGLERSQLKEIFELSAPSDLERAVSDFGLNPDELSRKVDQARAIGAEYESKNWLKIPLKFGLWFVFLGLVFVLMRRGKVGAGTRKALYLAAVAVFGVALGSDPSPMGTVKDTIHLLAAEGVVFPPRLIALCVFLALVVAFNKSICAWGCQLGVLQDLVFRLGRNARDTGPGPIRQFKIPFAASNTIRGLFLTGFTVVAVGWAYDIIEPIDPFRIYKPAHLGAAGAVFAAALLVAALFVYRPWCTLLCPFGFVGWLFEKLSIHRIRVDYSTCIACQACARACPSTVMEAILKRDKAALPDCFACGTCMDACPTGSISLSRGGRDLPPEGHFDKKPDEQDQS